MFEPIAQLLTWAVANPVYAFGALVGMAIGAFYGFDGWRGSTAEIDLSESPRVRNLLWVLGGAVTAIFGDIKALDPEAKRPLLLLYYFLSFLVTGITVVGFWGVLVALERAAANRQRRSYGYGFSDALGDYFFYGYRFYRERRAKVQENSQTRFFAEYSTQIAYAVTACGAVTPETKRQTAQSILQNISTVVKSYHRDSDDNLGIRANVMILHQWSEEFRESLLFVAQGVTPTCLVLRADDRNDNPRMIALPVAENPRQMLPGAPQALTDEDGFDVIDDTSLIPFKPDVPQQIQLEIAKYFKDQRFKSFASVTIRARRRAVGVVNVEGRVKELFGGSHEEKKRMVQFLLPFCSALGIIYAEG